MPKVTCVKGVTLGATGQNFVVGDTYEITNELFKDYGEYFKKAAGRPSNKMAGTDEDKSDGGEVTEETEETEAAE
jgi:hypothetical protein